MKKTRLLNSEISFLVASIGHTDEVTIADAGLPIPAEVERIDLALTHGVPSFIETVTAILSELQIEGVVVAEEMKSFNLPVHQQLLKLISEEAKKSEKTINISYVSHADFKQRTNNSKAVVRTGECSPYANVIFQSGVTF
ncbi:D-ribose pyranase [Alginatibacterium sediminis]|uniref:D-ribose pyranase n=1 Tax=Alginatibacterium sediminis TaxID=2164068 RepID=A0A420E6N9_9ALTE|nr:D-ribose pyranase [Alginatibacterium sediminis]RKF13653.1 D-ribose pyranase [Alginatibacterium sediminis]